MEDVPGSIEGSRVSLSINSCLPTLNSGLPIYSILAFLQRQAMPAVAEITLESFQNFKSSFDTIAVAYLDEFDDAARKSFICLAEDMHDDLVFGVTSDRDLAAAEDVGIPTIVVYKSVAEQKTVLYNNLSQETMAKFLRMATRPLVMEILPELYEDMSKVPFSVCVVIELRNILLNY